MSDSLDVEEHDMTPARLLLTLPPANFGAVQDHQIFRSAFPKPHNISFLRSLHIKTVLCLVETELSSECLALYSDTSVNRLRLDVAPNKNGEVNTSLISIYDALLVMLDIVNYPLHVHCNQGRHRTGCVVACMRKLQGWSLDDAVNEYKTYASPKARDGDIKLIEEFDPEAMMGYVKQVHFEHRPSLTQLLRSDLVDLDMLVQILSSMDGVVTKKDSLESNTSTRADSGVEICSPDIAGGLPTVQVDITECPPLAAGA